MRFSFERLPDVFTLDQPHDITDLTACWDLATFDFRPALPYHQFVDIYRADDHLNFTECNEYIHGVFVFLGLLPPHPILA